MSLFASQSAGAVILVLIAIAYVVFHAYVFFCRPDQWEAMQRRKHEKKMAEAAERKAAAGRVVGGIAGGIAKAILGAAIKGRPHH